MIFPLAREVEGEGVDFKGSANRVFLVNLSGKKIVYKLNEHTGFKLGTLKKVLKKIESPIYDLAINDVPLYKIRTKKTDIDEEKRILDEWRKNGIAAAIVLEKQDDALITKWIEGESLDTKLQIGTDQHVFSRFLDTFNGIRRLAKKDNTLLHTDAHLGNFVYSTQDGLVYAIDPGLVLNDKFSFEEKDAILSYQMLLSIDSLNINSDPYNEQFIDSLEPEVVERLLDLSRTIPKSTTYFGLREMFSSWYHGRQVRHPILDQVRRGKHLEELILASR